MAECENRQRPKPNKSDRTPRDGGRGGRDVTARCACDVTRCPAVFGYGDPERNLLRNWDFEEPLTGADWIVSKAEATRCQDSHTGNWSLHLHSRLHKTGQAYQRVYGLKTGTDYYYSMFLKLLSHPSQKMYFNVRLFILIKFPDDAAKKREKVGWLNFQRAPCDWQQIGGDFKTPDTEFEYVETHMEIEDLEVDYLVDTASLVELATDSDWRATANAAIDRHRKSELTLKIKLPRKAEPCDFEIRLKQTKRDFGIGAAICADAFNSPANQAYRDCFFQHFEWAVFANDTKWKPMEPKKGNIRFERVDRAIETLHEKGVTVRGHAIVWNNEKNCPDWVQGLEGTELQQEVDRRVDYVVSHFKSRLVQWDVCNETLHNHFFEERTGNCNQLEHLFRTAHQLDPSCQLYLNDYLVFRGGLLTSGQFNLARHLLSVGAPVHGIGIQSHLRTLPVQPHVLKKRIEIVAAAGLPMMITEFSVHTEDIMERAENLEKALRIYYSVPFIKGVILWHFSDQKGMTMTRGEDMALFEGPDFQPNEAGRRLQSLLEEWRTNLAFRPTSHKGREKVRAFHGQYELEVLHKGQTVWEHSFRVEPDRDLTVDIDVRPNRGHRASDDESKDREDSSHPGDMSEHPREPHISGPAV